MMVRSEEPPQHLQPDGKWSSPMLGSPEPANEINYASKKRHHEPPDQDAFHDPDCTINRTQALKFRFQVVLALAALPRVRLGFSPAGWAPQSFRHCQSMIPAPP